MSDKGIANLFVSIFLLSILAALAAAKGCSDGPRAKSTLEKAGYSGVTTGGYEFGCGDSQCTTFKALGPSGSTVKGVVSCGWFFNNCTVRIAP